MGDKSMKKEVKKKKKADIKSAPSATMNSVVSQPQLISKKKKPI